MPCLRMKSVSRGSISDEFRVSEEIPIPETPVGGARIKVHYAGACYTESQVRKSGQKHLRSPGIMDTSLFPGFEVAGTVDDVCNTVSDGPLRRGDRVILYSDSDSVQANDGAYAEYVSVKDPSQIVRIPRSLSMDVAAMLPSGALRAYAAISLAKDFMLMKKQAGQVNGTTTCNILIVGVGGLGLWTLGIAQLVMRGVTSRVRISIADNDVSKLELAKKHGCHDLIHWNEAIHEQHLIERTKNAFRGGVDVVIDFVSSPRTISRVFSVLNKDGVLLVGGNSKYDIPLSPKSLSANNISVLGIPLGTKQQLQELVRIVSNGELKPPKYKIYPVEEANKVFDMLGAGQIEGRAILQLCSEPDPNESDPTEDQDEGDFSVFLPTTDSEIKLAEEQEINLRNNHIKSN